MKGNKPEGKDKIPGAVTHQWITEKQPGTRHTTTQTTKTIVVVVFYYETEIPQAGIERRLGGGGGNEDQIRGGRGLWWRILGTLVGGVQ